MQRFEGKAALITGSASGIGLATTKRLAGEGARILACDANADLLRKEVQALADQGFDVTPWVFDVRDSAACDGAVAQAVARFGKLDILCNIAGVLMFKHFTDLTDEEWARVFAINVNGVFAMCRAAIPHLLATRGNIVNIASVAGMVGVPYNAPYSASKAAVLNLSRALAVEYASRGLRVNAVCPGSVLTPMTSGITPPANAELPVFARLSPLIDHARPDEIAGAVAYLASDEARFVTGSALVIDGGQTAI
ncbi:MAG: SDR family oxidoreductase [Rhodocyclaceae bacterium]|nr:SDR family oxidoreductase [Rhodocyclaceae bacterium]